MCFFTFNTRYHLLFFNSLSFFAFPNLDKPRKSESCDRASVTHARVLANQHAHAIKIDTNPLEIRAKM